MKIKMSSIKKGAALLIALEAIGINPVGRVTTPVAYAGMSKTDIKSKVFSIIEYKLAVKASEVTMNSSLYDDLGADSLDTVEVIIGIERAFKISIPDAAAEKLATVGAIVTYLQKQLS